MMHTDGPWKVAKTYSTHNSPNRWWETGVISATGRVAEAMGADAMESMENARLIAACPDMLSALRKIVEIENRDTGGDWDEIEEAREIASAALAIAEGK